MARSLKCVLPEDIIDFGVNSGYPYSVAYKYVPDYVAWVAKEVDFICLNIEKFLALPAPTPFFWNDTVHKKTVAKFKEILPKEVNGVVYEGQSIRYAFELMKAIDFQPGEWGTHSNQKVQELIAVERNFRAVGMTTEAHEISETIRALKSSNHTFFDETVIKANRIKYVDWLWMAIS